MDDTFQVNMFELFFDEKRILPSMYGGGDVLALLRAGHRALAGRPHRPESMITHRVRLDGINDALDQMRTGEALRTCVEL